MILVESCIRNYLEIYSTSTSSSAREGIFMQTSTLIPFEYLSDILIDLDNAYHNAELFQEERLVILHISQGLNNSQVQELTGISRIAVPTIFASACKKIADYLGDEYKTQLED